MNEDLPAMGKIAPSDKATEVARKRYDRMAFVYDVMETLAERLRFGKWRREQWSRVAGGNILEVGVGTGKNFPYYSEGAEVTAIDFSEKMLARARSKTNKRGVKVRLLPMDAQKLEFEDDTFDTVVATFVFLTCPPKTSPVLGEQMNLTR